MYKTSPSECVLVISLIEDIFVELDKSGLYFHPQTTIINSKKIIALIIRPTGMCLELDFDRNH